MARRKQEDAPDAGDSDLDPLQRWLAVTGHVVVLGADEKGKVTATIVHPQLGVDDESPTAEASSGIIEEAMGKLQEALLETINETIGEEEDEEEEDEEEEEEEEEEEQPDSR